MLIFAFILCLFLSSALLAIFRLRIKKEKLKNEYLEAYLESVHVLYNGLSDRIESVRRFRHDLGRHIRTLESILEQQQTPDAGILAYTDNLRQQYRFMQETACPGNEIIGTLLRLKQEECEQEHIPLHVDASRLTELQMPEFDLVGLLCNLLDNAIEANQRISGSARGISITLRSEENRLHIVMDNHIPCNETVDFKTRKSDKEEHGFGTKIIRDIVARYQGTLNFSIDRAQNSLHQEILLFPEQKGGVSIG